MSILFERRYQSIGKVYICDGGPLGNVTLPAGFTDRGVPPDRTPLNTEVVVDLAAVTRALRKA